MTLEETVAGGLAEALAPTLGEVHIERLRRLSAGANRETWSFDAVTAGPDEVTHELILQRDRAGVERLVGGCAREAEILRLAAANGVPVAEVVASGMPPGPLERSWTVNRRIAGETIGRRILRDDEWSLARSRFVTDCADALARIHRIRPDDVAGLDLPDQPDALGAQLAVYDALADPHPVMELAFRWLDANRPEPVGHTLVHGDFRLGNLMIAPDGLAAVLDWEITHLGDPGADLGWLCVRAWRFGGPARVGGIGEPGDLLDAYEAAFGVRVPIETLRWWEIFGTLRWGIICLQLGGDFRAGRTRSVEMATIGRRVVENEYDLLRLLPTTLERTKR